MKQNPYAYTVDFQRQILQYIVSDSLRGKQNLDKLHPDLFDDAELVVICDCLRAYAEKYKTVPSSRINLWQFFLAETAKSNVSADVKKRVESLMIDIYRPFNSDTPILDEAIVDFAQYRGVVLALQEYGPKLDDGREVFKQLVSKLQTVINISADDEAKLRNRGKFLLADAGTEEEFATLPDGHPSFLKGLNDMRSSGGFLSPEIIVLMSGPKCFKTGVLLNLAKAFMIDGLKVYYADTENGVRQIENRMKRCLVGATYAEMRSGKFKNELKMILEKAKLMGGDFINDFYTSDNSCSDVDQRLMELYMQHGWKPDVIFFDDIDKFKANDRKITDNRLRIKNVYTDVLALNQKWDMFAFCPSQVSRAAISKKVLKVKDLAEDISKAHTAHAVFAMCRTETDMEDGIARLMAVIQREGDPYIEGNEVVINIDAARMQVTEVDYVAAASLKMRWKGEDEEQRRFD